MVNVLFFIPFVLTYLRLVLCRSAHVYFCQTLARGQVTYDPRKHISGTTPILESQAHRLALIESILAMNARTDSQGNLCWPMCLSSPLHALVTSNLVCEPVVSHSSTDSGEDACAPERILVQSFLRSISEALMKPDSIKAMIGTSSEVVPLAHRDARLLLVALSRLSDEEQIDHVVRLFNILSDALGQYKMDDTIQQSVVQDRDMTSFLSRIITTATTMLSIVRVGPSLRDNLLLQIGPTQYPFPTPTTDSSTMDNEDNNEFRSRSWYRKESCFVGVFGDWESPIIPDAAISNNRTAFDTNTLRVVDGVLQDAMEIGFASTEYDRGQLLFACWNATGRKLTWDPTELSVSVPQPFNPNMSKVTILMDLRNDICRLNHDLCGDSILVPESLLSRIVRNQRRDESSESIQSRLGKMMDKAESILNSVLDTSDGTGVSTQTPVRPTTRKGASTRSTKKTLAATISSGKKTATVLTCPISQTLLEALTAYVSFVVSMHTSGPADELSGRASRNRRQKRKAEPSDSSLPGVDLDLLVALKSDEEGSDGGDFMDETNDESRIDEIARIHDSCNAFGAAPCHPDWLDTGCRLREGITPKAGLKIAERALKLMNRIGEVALRNRAKSGGQAIGQILSNEGDDPVVDPAQLFLISQWLGTRRGGGDNKTAKSYRNALAVTCSIDAAEFELLCQLSEQRPDPAAQDAWLPNASQRVIGALQDQSMIIEGWEASTSEYRASGEWEIILAESLMGACVSVASEATIDSETRTALAKLKNKERVQAAFRHLVHEQRWMRLCWSVLTFTMPTAALLRFCVSHGAGRKAHPLTEPRSCSNTDTPACDGCDRTNCSSRSENEAHSVNERIGSPRLNLSLDGKATLKQAIMLTASLSTCVGGFSDWKLAGKAVAANLLVDSSAFTNVATMVVLSNLMDGVFAMQPVIERTLSLTKKRRESAVNIADLFMTGVCGVLTREDHWSSGQQSSLCNSKRKTKISSFLAVLNGSKSVGVDTIDGKLSMVSLFTSIAWQDNMVGWMVRLVTTNLYSESSRLELVNLLRSIVEADFSVEFTADVADGGSRSGNDTGRSLALVGEAINTLIDESNLTVLASCLQTKAASSTEAGTKTGKSLQQSLAIIVALACSVNTSTNGGFRFLLDRLTVSLSEVSTNTFAEPNVLYLLFVLATQYGTLSDLGDELVRLALEGHDSSTDSMETDEKPDSPSDDDGVDDNAVRRGQENAALMSLESLLHYTKDLELLSDPNTASSTNPDDTSMVVRTSNSSTSAEEIVGWSPILSSESNTRSRKERSSSGLPSDPAVPNACSYKLRSGFHPQHWYHCYTCSIVADRVSP